MAEAEPNDTLDQAQDLGSLTGSEGVQASGHLGNSAAGAADVDWYQFTLHRPGRVSLAVEHSQEGTPLQSVLSLYNKDLFDPGDPYNPVGYRLLAQDAGSSPDGTAHLDRALAPGVYYVAVSGAGNRFFHPFLAGSGYAGSTGSYVLGLAATDLALGPNDGPLVLTADPTSDSRLASSPLVVRLTFSGALDPATLVPGQTVQLVYNRFGTFGTGDEAVPLAGINYTVPSPDSTAQELQLWPARPLAPGFYRVFLAGARNPDHPELAVVADPNSIPLGKSDQDPLGQDFTYTFEVTGVEGNTGDGALADDTAARAHELGDVSNAGLVLRSGAIGDDPFYDPTNTDPLYQPANDVDLYHFRVSGPGP